MQYSKQDKKRFKLNYNNNNKNIFGPSVPYIFIYKFWKAQIVFFLILPGDKFILEHDLTCVSMYYCCPMSLLAIIMRHIMLYNTIMSTRCILIIGGDKRYNLLHDCAVIIIIICILYTHIRSIDEIRLSPIVRDDAKTRFPQARASSRIIIIYTSRDVTYLRRRYRRRATYSFE